MMEPLTKEQVFRLTKQLREYSKGTMAFSAVVEQIEAHDEALRTQLAEMTIERNDLDDTRQGLDAELREMTQRAEELDTLTTMQDGGIRGLHAQIRDLTERAETYAARELAVELSNADITAQLAAMEQERAHYRPICLNCGREQPCMTEEEANNDGASIPCTFDPTPRELFARCKDLTAQLAASEAECESWRTVLRNEREAAQKQIAELRLRRQETINMAVQLECELEQLRGQLAEAQATVARYEARDKERAEQPAQHWEDGLRCLEDERDQLRGQLAAAQQQEMGRLKEAIERAAALEAQLAALTEKQRSCEAAFNGYMFETAHALSPDDPCVATTTEQIMDLQQRLAELQQERDEYKDTAAWFLALVPRANIGTEKTPSLRAYIEQIEQQLASARAALEALANLGGRTSNGNQLAQQALREMGAQS